MTDFNKKNHWENIYASKQLNEVSWYQPTPQTSLELILKEQPARHAAIIDIGGGDSLLVDHLLDLGFTNLSVLDISANAIDRAKERLGTQAGNVKWIVSDITEFVSTSVYDIWHDRAAFHFLTQDDEIEKYVSLAEKCIAFHGQLIIGTFTTKGPTKCSGIEIKQYTADSLKNKFKGQFEQNEILELVHPTPFGTEQEFVFCSFIKRNPLP